MSDTLSSQVLNTIINERVKHSYDFNYLLDHHDYKNIFFSQYNLLTRKQQIFPNQELIASNIVSKFNNRKILNVMVIAQTQSGKTGSMCATVKAFLENDINNTIPIENIYIITGLSSVEWKLQTKERMPEIIAKRVFHRSDLLNIAEEIKNKKNILIIMDEIQVAAKKGQSITKTFQTAGFLNKKNLYENDVKILEFTATPDGTIYELMKWEDASAKILAQAGPGYVSSYDLLSFGRIKQFKDLYGYDKETATVKQVTFENIQEIKDDIDEYDESKYHIIRTKKGAEQDITIENFKTLFPIDIYEFVNYDRENKMKDINNLLEKPPQKHTLIFIKEMLRCAKTLKKTYIGIFYDRFTNKPDDSTIIQGLVGRDTGYDNNGISITYTNIESIKKYNELWISHFENREINWNSKTTTFKNDRLVGKNTFNDPTMYDASLVARETEEKEPHIEKCKTQEEVKTYYRKLKEEGIMIGNGPQKKKKNPENDYYEANIRKNKKIYSCTEIYQNRKWGLKPSIYNRHRLHPCYENIDDKSTLQWWFIHYKP